MIRERILRGTFSLGAVLSRRKLAEEFGMSFLPISDALQRLENERLVESRPRVGTRVRTPTQEEVRGRYVVREALEAQSAKLCCENATFQERLELRRKAEQVDTLYLRAAGGQQDKDFLYLVNEHHVNLHMKIAEYARCRELKDAIEENHVLIYNWFYDVSAPRSVPERFHQELIEVITGDDPKLADEAMREHVRWGLNSLLSMIGPKADGDWRLRRGSEPKTGRAAPATLL